MNAHILLWQSGAALLSILGAIYPMRSTVEMARLIEEHDLGWRRQFQSDLSRLEQYAECGCELLVTDPVTDAPEVWRNPEADRDALSPRRNLWCWPTATPYLEVRRPTFMSLSRPGGNDNVTTGWGRPAGVGWLEPPDSGRIKLVIKTTLSRV